MWGRRSGETAAAGLPVRKGSMMTRRPSAWRAKQAWPWKVMVTMTDASSADVLLVRLAVEQLRELRRILHPQLDHPARTVGIAVHERRVSLKRRVHLGHRPRDRGVQLRDGFHRFDRAEHVLAREARSHLGQLHVHNV